MYQKQTRQSGFTIVELLIVIVVIGILAAITIVAYNGIQDRANNTTVQSDLATISQKIEVWRIDSPTGLYPTNSDLSGVDIQATKGSYLQSSRNNFYYCRSADGASYSFGVVSSANQGYFLTNSTVTSSSASSTYQADTCSNVGEPSASGISGYLGGSGWTSWVQ